ncbi:RrF2 family transcriptional regulator [Piscinibacterium candidicorallinum]|jgi:Rrf2 family nitric oxide-sensitive transcriptional repressor|uniref:RrF2 family transcriptional regulator n=1 Tax=Piscinibacterium candidicorallinum TaxID=1793872 RepID=A0ABV7HAM3_9BURK
MRLTQWTDYALRVLMYCARHEKHESAPTIAEIANFHGVSRSHLMKIVMELAANGWLATSRGRGGGLRLGKPANQIRIGDVVRKMEGDFDLVECFNRPTSGCVIDGTCKLKGVLRRALKSYLDALDRETLESITSSDQGRAAVSFLGPEKRSPSV